MSQQKVKTLVLGIGNLLIGDEGVGCKTAGELARRYSLPESVECVDGGTAGFELLSMIDDKEHLILIDALKNDQRPGTVVLVEGEHVPKAFLARTTPHQLGICDVLAAAQLSDTMPKSLTLYGIEPKQLEGRNRPFSGSGGRYGKNHRSSCAATPSLWI